MSCIASASGEEKARGMVVTASGYCYNPDAVTSGSSIQTHIQGFDHQDNSSSEMYHNLTSGMDIIGFNPHKNHFFNQHEEVVAPTESTAAAWHEQNRLLVEDPALRCVFPCEGNEKPSQGLSLSLSSSNPSTIGFQSFELRQQPDNEIGFVASSSRTNNTAPGFFSKQMNLVHQQQQILQDGFLGKASNVVHHHYHQGQQFLIRNSKYLGPAQELLTEFCNLGTNQNDHSSKIKLQKSNNELLQEENTAGSSSKNKSLCSLDLLDLQKRKTRLLQMLDEVDRRYKHYCEQMRGVTLSFEAMAGSGASKMYSALASKAMSRHFRYLRDAIVGQIKVTKKAMGDKDTAAAPGASRGETPRLRILDQTLRQQRAFQQMSMMESHPWRPQRGLPERSVSVLRAWLFEHFLHPYPSDVDKHILARQTGLSRSQVSNWFINARVRLWKPMVEEMYLEELKEKDNNNNVNAPDDHGQDHDQEGDDGRRDNQNQDQKPTHDQLLRIDNECLSSIVNNPEKTIEGKNGKSIQQHHHNVFSRSSVDSLSGMELDFSSYAVATHAAHQHGYGDTNGGGGGGGGGVSLTLGLQQHGGSGGVSLALSPVASQGSLFYPRDHIEDCQQVHHQYSSLLENEAQNLPYRNLMGAQLLHDLAG